MGDISYEYNIGTCVRNSKTFRAFGSLELLGFMHRTK